jgi:hypothetical protein
VFICPHLRLKQENLLTADDKGLTLINADEENRDRNNSDANRFEMILSPHTKTRFIEETGFLNGRSPKFKG